MLTSRPSAYASRQGRDAIGRGRDVYPYLNWFSDKQNCIPDVQIRLINPVAAAAASGGVLNGTVATSGASDRADDGPNG